MDTRFSMALHMLIMLSESGEPLSSAALARSVGTNASHIRKLIGQLKTAGLLSSSQGKSGYSLTRDAEHISLLDIYLATQNVQHVQLFHVHDHANETCPVGGYINETLSPTFHAIEHQLEADLAARSLKSVIADLYAAHASAGSAVPDIV